MCENRVLGLPDDLIALPRVLRRVGGLSAGLRMELAYAGAKGKLPKAVALDLVRQEPACELGDFLVSAMDRLP